MPEVHHAELLENPPRYRVEYQELPASSVRPTAES
jgi:hypothetical protein